MYGPFFLNQFSTTLLNDLQVKRHRYLRLRYQSCVDWTKQTDILRCNPKFHGTPRYDYVLVYDEADLMFGHFIELLRCQLPDKSIHDIALVHMLHLPSGLRRKQAFVNVSQRCDRWRHVLTDRKLNRI